MRPILLLIPILFTPFLQAQPSALPADDRIRLAEAFHLAESAQDSVWTDWSGVPFVVLLVTPEHEFLIRHPKPPDDFMALGYDSLLASEVYARPHSGQYEVNLLATFPAIRGVNTVVVGQPEHTGKTSTLWVLTMLHEHFHQLQYTRPRYYDDVAALDLAGDDQTGMWQLNYPFPYDSETVGVKFMVYKEALQQAVAGNSFEAYRMTRQALRDELDEADYRYLSFQLWQEGVARYIEHAVAQAAIRHHEPLPAFQALPDYVPYTQALDTLRARLANEMASLDLASWKRVVFYPIGATEALLLDAVHPGWKARYFSEPFYLERYHQEP